MAYIDDIMRAHPKWPRRIRHGEYIGVLINVQPLLGGEAAPIYRFSGGDAVGVDYNTAAVRVPAKEDDFGVVHCGSCGAELLCNACGDMPDICPVCHEGVDWFEWSEEGEDFE